MLAFVFDAADGDPQQGGEGAERVGGSSVGHAALNHVLGEGEGKCSHLGGV